MEWLVDGGWSDGRQAMLRRRTYVAAVVSLSLHGLLGAMVVTWPSAHLRPAPSVLTTVDLVAALPAAPAPQAAPKATPPPKAAPAPVAPPKPQKTVLPKQKAPLKTKPRKAAPPKPARPEELEYEDAMAKLREEMGETASSPPSAARPTAQEQPQFASSSQPGNAIVSREMAEWANAAKQHVRSVYVTPPEFLNRSLVTELEVRLSPTGVVLGNPRVVRSSGDPYWDDNAVRAVVRASPLPAPPEAGAWSFSFPSEER